MGKHYLENELKNLKDANDVRFLNMDLNDYKNRPKQNLEFQNFNDHSQIRENSFLYFDFHKLCINEEFERFQKQKIWDKPKQMRSRLG